MRSVSELSGAGEVIVPGEACGAESGFILLIFSNSHAPCQVGGCVRVRLKMSGRDVALRRPRGGSRATNRNGRPSHVPFRPLDADGDVAARCPYGCPALLIAPPNSRDVGTVFPGCSAFERTRRLSFRNRKPARPLGACFSANTGSTGCGIAVAKDGEQRSAKIGMGFYPTKIRISFSRAAIKNQKPNNQQRTQ